jgi:deoxyribose-phosphate aldolase
MELTELNNWVANQLTDNNTFLSEYSSNDLRNVVSCIDLTTLNSTDSTSSVTKFVQNGLKLLAENNLPNVAAYCVYSNFVPLVKAHLYSTTIDVACVATAFPHGQADLKTKTLEVSEAASNGADDIDVVINRGMVLDGDYIQMAKEVKSFSEASGKAHLKVILEVCDLNLKQIYLASKESINNGADFIKTSTGKGSSGASLESGLVMCLAIKEHFLETGKMVGFKAAGGISSSSNAMQYWNMVQAILGDNWLSNSYFRIGASSLLKNIISDLNKS